MKLLLDECVPRPVRREFLGHLISTIEEAGFTELKNGILLRSAAADNFEVLLTVDKNIEYQQNPADLPMGILILSARSNRLQDLLPLLPQALAALETIRVGEIVKVESKS